MKKRNSLLVATNDQGFYQYLQKINKIPSLSKEEEFLLAKAYLEQNDLAAAHKLVTSHLKLVAKIAIKYKNYGFPIPELVAEGNMGLMQAVKKYNPDLGFRLSTYAMWWIKAAIQEYILRSWSLVKIGTTATQKKLFFTLGKIKNKISHLYARPIQQEDFTNIAQELGISENEINEMDIRLSKRDSSLNNLINIYNAGDGELIEFVPDTRPNQETVLIHRDESSKKRQMLKKAMMTLNTRELEILTARRLEELPVTLEELSVKHKISKERVRQIEDKAVKKLQSFVLAKSAEQGTSIQH